MYGRKSQYFSHPSTFNVPVRGIPLGGGYGFNPPPKLLRKKFDVSSVSVFHTSVQWSFNVDQFMQTFDS